MLLPQPPLICLLQELSVDSTNRPSLPWGAPPLPQPRGPLGGQRGTISWELGSGSLYPWLSPVYLFLLELNSLLKHSPDHLLLTAWCGE